MILFLLMNLIVGVSAFLLVFRIFGLKDFIDSILSLFILYFAQIIVTELILGILGILYLQNVILLNLVIFLIFWSIAQNKKSSFDSSAVKGALRGFLSNKVMLFITSAILAFGLVKICINLVNPPFGWDSLNYHFTFPVEWLKHGNLDNPIVVSCDPSPPYYPINGSLYFFWLMSPLKNVFLADLGQIPFFTLAFLAVYSLARKLNLNRESSYFSAALFTLIPNYFKQMEIAYVDVIVAALFLVSLNYLLLLNKKFSLRNALIYSISLGLLLGTKTTALPYSLLLFLPFTYLCLKNINKAYLFIISLIAIAVFGGFAYLRNFVDTANPLYPLDFKLFGRTIFKGVMNLHTYHAHFKMADYRLSKLLFHEGLGLQSLLFILPSLFLAPPLALIKRRKNFPAKYGIPLWRENFNLLYFLLLPILMYLIYRYIIPQANVRYLYPLLGVGMIMGFYLTQLLNIPRNVVNILVIICTLASAIELAKYAELITSAALALSLLFFLPSLIKRKSSIKRPFTIYLASVLIIGTLILLKKDYVRNEYPRYVKMVKYSGFWPDAATAWDWLNRNTNGNNIAYIGRPAPFPLYGTNFKNNVYYVSVNKTEPAKLHYFPDSHYCWDYDFLGLHRNLEEKGNYRGSADYSIWLNNLLKRKIDYLFIYSLHQVQKVEFPFEDEWSKANPHKFTPVFTNETIHIYKIIR